MYQTVLNDTLLDSPKTLFHLFQAKRGGIFLLIQAFEKKNWDTFRWFGKEEKSPR